MSETEDNRIIWQPERHRIEASALYQFAQKTRAQHGCKPDDYQGLLNWSVTAPEEFYNALWDELDIIGVKGRRAVAPSDNIRDVRFFPESYLNYAENLLREPDDRLAIIAHRDDGTRRTITRKELYDKVSSLAQGLQNMGVGKGDRIGAIITHDLEAVIGYLATSSLGAIWSSCSPDFGPASASDRLSQISPKVLIAVASYQYAGKKIDVLPTIREVCNNAKPDHLILISGQRLQALEGIATHQFDDLLKQYPPSKIDFKPMPFDAPLAILYSSGTTGVPKCITHSAGGLLLQHLKELKLQSNIKANEPFFYFTTCGWMMWNWQVSALALGATLITYDGNPAYPTQSRLIDLIDDEHIVTFGTSAKFIDACNNAGLIPIESHNLSSLKTILSTGSALIPSAFDYIYRNWKSDVHLASISGGTDICACFLGGNPLQPVWRGELQGAMLGMDMDVLNDEGQSLPRPQKINENGQSGELVCRNAHLSMPLKFWGDDDGSRYHAAYFERFAGLWAHGDFAEKRFSGGYIIHGRSDTTLNPGGVRIGTSEIYRQVETIDVVEEAVAVGQDINGDQRIVLFIKLKDGENLTDEMRQIIRARIRSGASPRHVPAKIIAINAIPHTRSGKISEIAVRDTIHGRAVKNIDALMNPEALELYKNIAELKD
ncbi:acetoacetate--CoA ligase [Brucellaceae bacterium C25G]